MTAVGFEPTPFRNGALSHRLRPLGQTVLLWGRQRSKCRQRLLRANVEPSRLERARAAPGIEPGTSRTRSENHAARPSSRMVKRNSRQTQSAQVARSPLQGRVRSWPRGAATHAAQISAVKRETRANSATGTRTRVARVRAEYPNQLDYSGFWQKLAQSSPFFCRPRPAQQD